MACHLRASATGSAPNEWLESCMYEEDKRRARGGSRCFRGGAPYKDRLRPTLHSDTSASFSVVACLLLATGRPPVQYLLCRARQVPTFSQHYHDFLNRSYYNPPPPHHLLHISQLKKTSIIRLQRSTRFSSSRPRRSRHQMRAFPFSVVLRTLMSWYLCDCIIQSLDARARA